MNKAGFIATMLAFLCVQASYGQVVVEKAEVALTASIKTAQVEATFRITNKGNSVVAITKVNPSCGCTTTQLDKAKLGAGESALLRATVQTGGHTGAFLKTITIETDEERDNQKLLLVRIKIPAPFKPSAQRIGWAGNETVQTITLTPLAESSPRITEVRSDPRVKTVLKQREAGSYVLEVKRSADSSARHSDVVLVTDVSTDAGEKKIIVLQQVDE